MITIITRYYPIMCSTPKISCRYQTVPETLSTTHPDNYNTRSIKQYLKHYQQLILTTTILDLSNST